MPVLKNARHELFAQYIAKGMSATEAYVKAGYKPNGPNAGRMTKKDEILNRVAELMAPAVAATELTVERVLKELTCLAFYDVTAVLEAADGKITPRDPASLPEDLRRPIVGIKPVEIGGERLYEYKFADKQKALDSLARYLQMFKDTLVVENVFRVVHEMDDDELDRRLAELERALGEAKTLGPASLAGAVLPHCKTCGN